MTLPPRPPSPPSGPPIGTNFSRRKELIPDPPSPALVCTTTRSMNIVLLPFHTRPQEPHRSGTLRWKDRRERFDCFVNRVRGHTNIERSTKMRVQLTILLGRRARGYDAELAPREIEVGSGQHLTVAFEDHPVVEVGMEFTNIRPKPLVTAAVNTRTGAFSRLTPARAKLAL